MASKNQLMNAAVSALKSRQWATAEHWLIEAQRLTPFDPHILYNLGIVAHEQGRSHDAISLWKRTLGADPRYVAAMANLGALLTHLGHEQEGLRYTLLAVERDSRNLNLLTNLIHAWMRVGNSSAALEVVDKALGIRPQNAPLLILKMHCLNNTKRLAEAKELATAILAMDQANPEALRVLTEISAHLSDWTTLAAYEDRLRQVAVLPGSVFNPTMLMFAFDDPALLCQVARLNPACNNTAPRPPRSWTTGKISLGYLSADFREHPVSHMLLEVLLRHDRERFRVVLISTAPVDDSAVAQHLLAHVDEHVDVTGADTQKARQLVIAARIDVLVDLSGLTQGNRCQVLQTRPCPAQVLWLGCPTTTGMAHYDAFLVDAILAPPGYEAWCREPLIRLPSCYHPISPGLNDGNSQLTREALGIPGDALLIGMLQTPNRVRPPFIHAVAEIIARHPTAHLMLRAVKESQPQVSAQLAALGLPVDRLSFAPRFPERIDYLQLVQLLDLVIDSHPYGGHSTSGEAMALGVPVLTMAGASIHARVAASMLHELNLGDLVAHSMPQFLTTLASLMAEPPRLADWKRRFTAARAEPADARHRRLTRALEDSFVQVLSDAVVAP